MQQAEIATLRAQLEVSLKEIASFQKATRQTLDGPLGNVLAFGIIKSGQMTFGSSGLKFDGPTGKISFENPKGVQFTPIVSYYSPNGLYATGSCFIKNIGTDFVVLGEGAQDTS